MELPLQIDTKSRQTLLRGCLLLLPDCLKDVYLILPKMWGMWSRG